MTTWDTTALDAIAAKPASAARTGPAPWQPLDLSTLAPGTYLAADQSLTAFGLVLLSVYPEDVARPHVLRSATLKMDPYTDHDDMMDRVEGLELRLLDTVRSWTPLMVEGSFVVHENPPTGGGKFKRPEVSLMTAYAFRRAMTAYRLTRLKPVTPQSHKRLITGDHTATKPAVAKALAQYVLPHLVGANLIANEATRDALCVALAAAHRRAA